jgi:hypothetical protein
VKFFLKYTLLIVGTRGNSFNSSCCNLDADESAIGIERLHDISTLH